MSKPLLLLDGDLIIFRNAIACEREVKWDDENWVLQLNEDNAWSNIQAAIEGYKTKLKSDRVVLVFSEGRSFRYGLTPDYKANRKDTRKPLGYSALVARAKEAYTSSSFSNLEADDVMGILSTKPGKAKRIIVSDDKDMKTIPGLLYRQGELTEVREGDADYWHLYQTLIGDTADGFPGLPGCGPKTAEKILSVSPGDRWGAVVEAFSAKGLTEEDALLQARLARILRWSDWNSEKKEPILWTP
jgi:DNA polymerase-1